MGRVFKFHNDVDTDQIIASQYLLLPNLEEMKEHAFESLDPDFPKKVKPGYKKKRKYQVEQVVRKQKRAMIRDDIRRQKKERARQAQIAKRMEEGNDNW